MTTTAAVLLLTWALETWWGGKSSIILAWHDREMTISYEMMMGSLVVVVKAMLCSVSPPLFQMVKMTSKILVLKTHSMPELLDFTVNAIS